MRNYLTLRNKVDRKFQEILARHRKHLQCMKGCTGCCPSGLSIFSVEAGAIKEYLVRNKEGIPLVKRHGAVHQDVSRCEFLLEDGSCSIYEARPIICRSHGSPITYINEYQEVKKDVCPLNFQGINLDLLEDRDFFNLDTVNTLLSLINRQFDEGKNTPRVPLTIDALRVRTKINSQN